MDKLTFNIESLLKDLQEKTSSKAPPLDAIYIALKIPIKNTFLDTPTDYLSAVSQWKESQGLPESSIHAVKVLEFADTFETAYKALKSIPPYAEKYEESFNKVLALAKNMIDAKKMYLLAVPTKKQEVTQIWHFYMDIQRKQMKNVSDFWKSLFEKNGEYTEADIISEAPLSEDAVLLNATYETLVIKEAVESTDIYSTTLRYSKTSENSSLQAKLVRIWCEKLTTKDEGLEMISQLKHKTESYAYGIRFVATKFYGWEESK